jgi:hypothetical protein
VLDARGLAQRYEAVAKSYEDIAAQVSQFDVRSNAAVSAATSRVAHIADPDLKRAVAEAQAALEQREAVTAAVVADWRKLGQATSDYSRRGEAAVLKGDKAPCADLGKGIARRDQPRSSSSATRTSTRPALDSTRNSLK